MLVLSRHRDEQIMVGDNVVITIVDIRGDKVRVGIEAPPQVPVHRLEVYERVKREERRAAVEPGLDIYCVLLKSPTDVDRVAVVKAASLEDARAAARGQLDLDDYPARMTTLHHFGRDAKDEAEAKQWAFDAWVAGAELMRAE